MFFLALLFFLSFQYIDAVHPSKINSIARYSQKLIQAFKSTGNNDAYHTFPPEADQYVLRYGIAGKYIKNGIINDEFKIPGKITYPDNSTQKIFIRLLINPESICFHRELNKKVTAEEITSDPVFGAYLPSIKNTEFPPLISAGNMQSKANISTSYEETPYSISFPVDKRNKYMRLLLYKPELSNTSGNANQ